MSVGPVHVRDRYLLGRTLGAGGMGRVYQARDEVLGRDVALKEILLPPELLEADREALRHAMLREGRAAARLSHPGVARVYDTFESEGRAWIVMEYVPSRSLQEVLDEDGPLPPRRVAEIGLAVLDALRSAHAAGVRHRDVKPANVLLADDGRVVLTDFGVAAVDDESIATKSGLVMGSPQYMAPERVRDGDTSEAGDLWSLGATLYAAVEGHAPYTGHNVMETITAIVSEEPQPPTQAGELRAVLEGLLRKSPGDRIAAEETQRLLAEALGPAARSEALPKRRRRSWLKPAPTPPPAEDAPASPPATATSAAPSASPGDDATSASPSATPADDVTSASPSASPGDDVTSASPSASPGDAATSGSPSASPRDDVTSASPRDDATPGSPRGEAASASPRGEAGSASPRAGAAAGSSRPEAGSASPRVGAATPRRRSRRVAVLVAAGIAVLLLVAGVFVWTDRRGTAPNSDAAEPVPTRTEASPGVTTASPSPSAAASSSAVGSSAATSAPPPATTPVAARRPALPPGWTDYRDPTGFAVYVPKGWTRTKEGSIVYFRTPGRVLGIDQTNDPQWNPVADWQGKAEYRVSRGDFPAYHEIGIKEVKYFLKAADWEFTFTRGGTRQHVNNRGVVTSNHQAYGFYWQTSDAAWSGARKDLQLVFDSFRPAT